MILKRAATLGLLDTVVGAGLAAAGLPLVSSLLLEVDATASAAIATGAATPLLVVMLTAAWYPA